MSEFNERPTLTLEREHTLAWIKAWAEADPHACYSAPTGNGCAYFHATAGDLVGSCVVGQYIDAHDTSHALRNWVITHNMNVSVGVRGLAMRELLAPAGEADAHVVDALSFAQDANDEHFPRWYVALIFERALEMGGNEWMRSSEYEDAAARALAEMREAGVID